MARLYIRRQKSCKFIEAFNLLRIEFHITDFINCKRVSDMGVLIV